MSARPITPAHLKLLEVGDRVVLKNDCPGSYRYPEPDGEKYEDYTMPARSTVEVYLRQDGPDLTPNRGPPVPNPEKTWYRLGVVVKMKLNRNLESSGSYDYSLTPLPERAKHDTLAAHRSTNAYSGEPYKDRQVVWARKDMQLAKRSIKKGDPLIIRSGPRTKTSRLPVSEDTIKRQGVEGVYYDVCQATVKEIDFQWLSDEEVLRDAFTVKK